MKREAEAIVGGLIIIGVALVAAAVIGIGFAEKVADLRQELASRCPAPVSGEVVVGSRDSDGKMVCERFRAGRTMPGKKSGTKG